MLTRLAAGLALIGALFGASAPLRAQDDAAALRREQAALFQRMFREPSNIEVTVRYGEVSTRLGDNEAAIGALERLLFFEPALKRVRFELGLLYYKIGSYEVARDHLRKAIDAPDLPENLRARARGLLEISDRRLSPDQWSGFISSGLRYQTNANYGPNDSLIRISGAPAIVDRSFARRADFNAFGLAGINYVHDFGNQRGDTLEASFIGAVVKQFRVTEYDFGFAQLQIGPRLALFPDVFIGVSIKPYALVGGFALNGEPSRASVGGGVSLLFNVASGTIVEALVEHRKGDLRSTATFPSARVLGGDVTTVAGLVAGPLTERLRWQARLSFSRNDALFSVLSYDRAGFDVEFPLEFDAPLGGGRAWTVTPFASVNHFDYRRPDPIVDARVRRRDLDTRFGGRVDVPIFDKAVLNLQVHYAATASTLPNYDERNLAVIVGTTVPF